MNIIERIKELNQRQFTESILDDSGLIEDEPVSILDDSGLIEDEPFKSIADIDGHIDYGLGMRYFI